MRNSETKYDHRWTFGRLQIGYDLAIHRFSEIGDRWVFTPYFIWDRKA